MVPSTPLTRRRTLLAVAGALAGLAGCNARERSSPTATPTVPDREDDPDSVPPHRRLRGATDDPLLWLPDETTPGDESNRRRPTFVATREAAERIRFADVEGADDARAFLEETAFDSETVFVEYLSVRSCYELQLCRVSWSETEIDTQFGRVLRDAEVACEAEARESTAWLIRISGAFDPDRITRFGTGVGGDSCGAGGPPREREGPITADAVPATNGSATTEPPEGDDG
ncbi:hypothetical protein [Halobaculum sp. EA56]|uniref:hypothetical protein n=1 Tax=Halobaculum sp. EA56 TaxID=3421648 RepID=UPI003EBF590D